MLDIPAQSGIMTSHYSNGAHQMSVQDIIDELKILSMVNSKEYYEGSINGCFALGWFAQDMVSSLDEMGLTENQIQILKGKVDRMHRLIEEYNETH